MRILHTSDWHIGKKLMEHERLDEFREFFAWLEGLIRDENIDALIVAGDIFDNGKPTPDSQEIYYSFLGRVAGKSCRHIIITSGNHDSPRFIDAPAEIMNRCDIHVIGRACENEIITLRDSDGRPEMIVCAVPFLLESDIMTVFEDDTQKDRSRRLREGIMNHYSVVFAHAREIREGHDIPIIAMGHLFLEAGKIYDNEGERSTYLGTAIKVGSDIFPEDIAYTALGHLHSPQHVGRVNIRYSGSPIALSFGEWGTQKSVSVVDFEGRNFAGVREIPIPVSQKMARVAGDMAGIEAEICGLVEAGESVWIEVTYTGDVPPGNIREELEALVKGSKAEILNVIDEMKYISSDGEAWIEGFKGKTLDEIDPLNMLKDIMKARGLDDDTQKRLAEFCRKIIQDIKAGGLEA